MRPWRLRIAWCELEGGLARVVEREVGGEGTSGFGDELVEQVCLAGGEEFGNLGAFDRLLADHFARLELAGLLLGLRLFADVIRRSLEHAPATLGTFAERFLTREVELHGRLLRLAVLG